MSVTVDVHATKSIGLSPKYILRTKRSVRIDPTKFTKHPNVIIDLKFAYLKHALKISEPVINVTNPNI